MIRKNQLKESILDDIKDYPEKHPFIAHFWKIEIIDKFEEIKYNSEFIQFGHYKTKAYNSKPIYKPISKIIDFSKLDE